MSSLVLDITTRLSDLVETTLREGPQIVAKDGVEVAVLVSIEDWKRIRSADQTPLIDPLTDPNGPRDFEIPRLSGFRPQPLRLDN